jgi:putative ABC transport system ATP-binding protein
MEQERMPPPLIELRNVAKSYVTPAGVHFALREVELAFAAGESVAIVGRSGSGKSTLLNLVAGIDRPTSGEVSVAGLAVHAASENALARWRGRKVGVVFQFFQLLPTLTVAENVVLPMDFCDVRRRANAGRARSSCSTGSASRSRPTSCPRSSRADNSSARRSHAHSPTIRRSSWPTNRPAISTRRRRRQ